MPLSEHEQRVLRQIERQFEEPRGFARATGAPANARQALRKLRWSAAWFVLGLVALSLSFVFSWVLGLAGFLVMLVAAVTLVRSLRWLGRQRLQEIGVRRGAWPGPRSGWHGQAGTKDEGEL
ncbi:MAG: DUF3040 domain-containing protein [Acidimicrobiales bacterium]